MTDRLEFTSYREFVDCYYPGKAERQKIEAMTPSEYGRYLAQKHLERIRKREGA